MAKKTIHLVTRASDGSLRVREFQNVDTLHHSYQQIAVDDCSTDLSLRGLPVFRGLVGPIPEGKQVARYESPEVFEMITKEWSKVKSRQRRRRASAPAPALASMTMVDVTVSVSS